MLRYVTICIYHIYSGDEEFDLLIMMEWKFCSSSIFEINLTLLLYEILENLVTFICVSVLPSSQWCIASHKWQLWDLNASLPGQNDFKELPSGDKDRSTTPPPS